MQSSVILPPPQSPSTSSPDIASCSNNALDTAGPSGRPTVTLPVAEHLLKLFGLRDQLDAKEIVAGENILKATHRAFTQAPNSALMTPKQQAEMAADRQRLEAELPPDEAVRGKASQDTGLRRRASFMLIEPIARDVMQANADGKFAWAAIEQLPMTARAVLTAQVDTLKRHVERVSLKAMEDAWTGVRHCPFVLDRVGFAAFLRWQKPAIDQVLEACTHSGEERRTVLRDALNGIAHAYLEAGDSLPLGMDAKYLPDAELSDFGPEPVSVELRDHDQCISRYHLRENGDKVTIEIGVNELDTPQAEPDNNNGMWLLHAMGLDQYGISQKQAGAYLHKLFVGLVNLEEKICLGQNMNKDGTPMRGAPHGTYIELGYTGSRILGDKLPETDPAMPAYGKASQRDHAMNAFDNLASLARTYWVAHGTPLLLDPQLDDWLGGAAYYRDALIVKSPAARMQLLAMEHIAAALVENKSLE
jgi:hypothetical protein